MGTRVLITVPKRPQFGDAYYALQRRFDSGSHEIEVTAAQLLELKGDPVITVVELADDQKPVKKAAKPESTSAVEPAPDREAEATAAPAEEPKTETEPKAAPAEKPAAEKPASKGPGRRKATS